jgi:hypothetical protein
MKEAAMSCVTAESFDADAAAAVHTHARSMLSAAMSSRIPKLDVWSSQRANGPSIRSSKADAIQIATARTGKVVEAYKPANARRILKYPHRFGR